jgi:phosphopantothenoylcysteine decarboxylase / phosphopantothenate---cysteine ligase
LAAERPNLPGNLGEAVMLAGKRILLIIGGGIAAYKALELLRLIQKAGGSVVPVLTRAGAEFVTPLSVGALAGAKVYQDLFDLTDEAEMGHIQLSRAADLVVVAPATADLLAKMAGGRADDLASTLLLATDKRVLVAPARWPAVNMVRGGWRSRRRFSRRSGARSEAGLWRGGMWW